MKGWNKIDGRADCAECDWSCGDSYDGDSDMSRKARKHAEKTGHEVMAFLGFEKIYTPEED